MALLSGVQFLLLFYLFINDLAEQSIPLFELDKEYVWSLLEDADHGVCPFVISPNFLFEDTEPKVVLDYSEDKFREIKTSSPV